MIMESENGIHRSKRAWNRLFWVSYSIVGLLTISVILLSNITSSVMLFALIIIALGAFKLAQENSEKHIKDRHEHIEKKLSDMSGLIGAVRSHVYINHNNKSDDFGRHVAANLKGLENEMVTILQEVRSLKEMKGAALGPTFEKRTIVVAPPAPMKVVAKKAVVKKKAPVRKTAKKPKSPAFEKVWKQIHEIVAAGYVIKTLADKSRLKVDSETQNVIKVRQGKNNRIVSLNKSDFRAYWIPFAKRGVLNFIDDIKNNNLKRKGSVIISILATLPNVEYTLNPRVLHLMDNNTHKPGRTRKRRF